MNDDENSRIHQAPQSHARTKEQIYDAEVNPLMAQILDLCKKHHIAMLASFCLDPGDENGDNDLYVTSHILTKDCGPNEPLVKCRNILFPEPKPMTAFVVKVHKRA